MLNMRSVFAETMKGVNASQLFHGIDEPTKSNLSNKLEKMLIK